jgi:hypothetical protein
MAVPARVDALDPLDRLKFDAAPVCRWRVTWPDGTSEVIEGHMLQWRQEGGTVVAAFHYNYLGSHRAINMSHARDIEELTS